MRVIIRLGMAIVMVALAVGCRQAEKQESAEQILQRVGRKYASLQQLRGSLNLRSEAVVNEDKRIQEGKILFRLQRPNKALLRLEMAGVSLWLTCDGKQTWLYNTATNAYLMDEAPEDMPQLAEGYGMPLMGLGRVTLGLLGQDPAKNLAELVQESSSVKLQGGETLDGAGTHRLALETELGELTLWIDKESFLVRKARLNPHPAIARLKAEQPELKQLSFFYEATLRIDDPLAASLPESFGFEPPAQARLVQEAEELFSVELAGQPMRDFRLEGLAEGQTWQLSEHKGKVVVLNFFATWCPPCRAELPMLQKVHDDYKDKDFILLAINIAEERPQVAAFMKESNLNLNVALDRDAAVATAYGADTIPRTIVIDQNGSIHAVHKGYAPTLDQQLRQEIDALLAK